MSANNGFFLVGKLVNPAEVKTTNAGKKWAKIMLEVDEFKYDGTPMGTAMHNLTAFGKTSEVLTQFVPGDILAVAGNVGSRKWEKDGKVSYFVDLNINEAVPVAASDYGDPTEPDAEAPAF